MTFVYILLGLIALAILLVLVMASRKPDVFRLERQMTIAAPPEVIAGHITDFRKWAGWSPWEAIDPTMQRSYSGAADGEGAIYDWAGSGKAGTGRMEIKAIAPGRAIVIALDFIKPFQANNTAEFTFVPGEDGRTTVIWAMYGPAPFMSKVMHTVMDMDKLVGKDFETGLTSLKTLSEHPAT